MPYAELMTWDEKRKYWRRFQDGKRFTVSCRQLGLPKDQHTKEASREAANEWWKKIEATLTLLPSTTPAQQVLLNELDKRKAFATRFDPSLLPELQEREQPIKDTPNPNMLYLEGPIERHGIWGKIADGDQLEAYADMMTDRKVWQERTKRVDAGDKERSFGKLVEVYMKQKLETEEKGLRATGTTQQKVYSLNRFVEFVGATTSIDTMGYDLWHSWCEHLQANKDVSTWTAKRWMISSKAFVKWLYKSDRLKSLPKNLDEYQIKVSVKEVEIFTDDEMKTLLANCSDNYGMRAILLLALNTGMNNVDISELKKSELDLKKERITRKRIKTKEEENVPTVTYPLWKETIEAIKEVMAKDGEYALLTSNGTKWVNKERVSETKVNNTDNIRSAFVRLCKKTKIEGKSFKMFRATSASKLGNNERFRAIAPLFLGHAPSGVFERHYLAESGSILAEGIKWLRTQYEI